MLEAKEYDFLTRNVLVNPPRVPLEEAAIEVRYAQLAPEAKQMFEWAHILHRQMYDVLADERLNATEKDAEMARLLGYYKTRPDVAFSSRPKSMKLMQEMRYSLAFRRKYPKFNGLIWGYHWLQVGLYEPLLVGQSPEERQALVRGTVARFWQMLARPVDGMPHQMPMTAAVAPAFAARYAEVAIIFDNLHSMHDVISDILANPIVPRARKRAEILLAAERFRDDTSYVMTEEAWRVISKHMGVENMGGASVGFLPEPPVPSVSYGAVMTHDDRTGAMTGFTYGSAKGGEHAAHAAPSQPSVTKADTGAHAGHAMSVSRTDTSSDSAIHLMHMRMLEDPVTRARIASDSVLRRMMIDAIARMPLEHREHMTALMNEPVVMPTAKSSSSKAATPAKATPRQTTKAARKPITPTKKPAPKPVDPHAGHRPNDLPPMETRS